MHKEKHKYTWHDTHTPMKRMKKLLCGHYVEAQHKTNTHMNIHSRTEKVTVLRFLLMRFSMKCFALKSALVQCGRKASHAAATSVAKTKNTRLNIKQWQLFTKWKIVIQTIRIMWVARALTLDLSLSIFLYLPLSPFVASGTGAFYYLLWKHIISFVLHFRPWNRSFYIVMWQKVLCACEKRACVCVLCRSSQYYNWHCILVESYVKSQQTACD